MNKNLQKSLALGMAIVSVAPIATNSVMAAQSSEIVTTTGHNRYHTAALLAKKSKNKNVAILVNTDNTLADGLSASGLAGVLNAPILLTKKDKIPKETMDALSNRKMIYIIGGKNAISKSVEDKLKSMGCEIERIDGKDRVDTSKNVANIIEHMSSKDKTEMYLVNGYKGEADAMSIAPVAAKNEGAIILSNNKDHDSYYKTDYIIGSTSVISNDIAKKSGGKRIGGKDRYETNKMVINNFYHNIDNVNVTKGDLLVDALTASAIKEPILLASERSDKSILKNAKSVNIIGGLSKSIVDQIKSIVMNNGSSDNDKPNWTDWLPLFPSNPIKPDGGENKPDVKPTPEPEKPDTKPNPDTKPDVKPHTHKWVHHDAVIEKVVVAPAWEQTLPVYSKDYHVICQGCGKDFGSDRTPDGKTNYAAIDAQFKHVFSKECDHSISNNTNYWLDKVQIGTEVKKYPAITKDKVVSPAYDVCKECGTKRY